MYDEPEKSKKKITDPKVALSMIEGWCARQERCQQEVRDKLYNWGLWEDAVESIIVELISRGFVSEERFAVLFAGGKFRMNKWGKIKIKTELGRRRIPAGLIRKALEQIDGDKYEATIEKLVADKWRTEKEKHPLKKKQKVLRYMAAKGFEMDMVSDAINKLQEK